MCGALIGFVAHATNLATALMILALMLLGVAARDCVYVGDDLRDVIAGNAAGMPTIAAEYGYLGEAGCADDWPATGWITAPLELLAWLPDARPPGNG